MADKEARDRVRHQERKRLLRIFHGMARQLLTRREQEELNRTLRIYQAHRQVELLMSSLRGILNTPAKLDLLVNIRNFIPPQQVALYDQLAPYHQMAHPAVSNSGAPVYQSQGSVSHRPRYLKSYNPSPNLTKYHSSPNLARGHGPKAKGPKANGPTRRVNSPPATSDFGSAANEPPNSGPLHSLTLVKNGADGLGFCIRGGSEHGLGIYVSEIEPDSPADMCGLTRGDCILEVNNVSFENIASTSAVVVFTGNNRLKMLIRRVGKIPGHKYAQEKTIWYDTVREELVEGDFEEEDTSNHPLGLSHVEGIIERRIHLHLKSQNQFMGFNIRGGKEYDIGIYVSKIDPGGLAEQKGLKIGDLITSVNRKTLQGFSHVEVVEQIRSSASQVVLTVRDVGRYPAYKEKYAEYSWVDVKTGEAIKTRSGHIVSVPVSHDTPITNRGPNFASLTNFPEPQNSIEEGAENDREMGYGTRSERNSFRAVENDDDTLFGFELEGEDEDSNEMQEEEEKKKNNNSPEMLVPHRSDIVLVERIQEEESAKKDKKGKSKKKNVPRPELGIIALQRENDPDWAAKAEQIQSLRVPGDINPREASSADSTKKSKSFREKLFGTKSRSKLKDSEDELDLPRRRVRKPLSSISFKKEKPKVENRVDEEAKERDLEESRNVIESESKRLLTADEATAVMRHLAKYEQGGSLPQLMIPLRALLDSEEKVSIFIHVENLVREADVTAFKRETKEITREYTPAAVRGMNEEEKSIILEDESMSSGDIKNSVTITSGDTSISTSEQVVAASSQLRRVSQVQDLEVHPSDPGSLHQYEIHGPNSNSRVYVAKPEYTYKLEKKLKGTYSVSSLEYDNHYNVVPSLRPVDSRRGSRTSVDSQSIDSPRRYKSHYGSNPAISESRSEISLQNNEGHYGSSPMLLETGYPIQVTNRDTDEEDLYNGSLSRDYSRASKHTRQSSDTNLSRDLYSDTDVSIVSSIRFESNSSRQGSPEKKTDTVRSHKSDASSAVYESVSSIYNHIAPRAALKTSETVNPNKPVNSLRETRKLALLNNMNDHETQTSAFSSRATSLADLADLEERRSRSEDALSALDFLDDFDEGSSSGVATPLPSKSTRSSNSPHRSPRHSPRRSTVPEVTVSDVRVRPVFVAPPPPDDPPPGSDTPPQPQSPHLLSPSRRSSRRSSSGRSSPHPKLLTQESNEMWREWARDDEDEDEGISRLSPQPSLNIDVQPDPRQIPRPSSAASTISTGFSKELPIYEDIAYPASQTRSVSPSPTHTRNGGYHSSSPVSESINSDAAEAQNIANDNLQARNRSQNSRLERFMAAQQNNMQDVVNMKNPSEANSTRPVFKSEVNLQLADDEEERMMSPRTIKQYVTIHLPKNKRSLGLSISGGVDSRSQPKIKIDHIFPGGAASDVTVLRKGLEIVSVDDVSLKNVTHEFAVNMFRKAFANKAFPTMQLVVGPL